MAAAHQQVFATSLDELYLLSTGCAVRFRLALISRSVTVAAQEAVRSATHHLLGDRVLSEFQQLPPDMDAPV